MLTNVYECITTFSLIFVPMKTRYFLQGLSFLIFANLLLSIQGYAQDKPIDCDRCRELKAELQKHFTKEGNTAYNKACNNSSTVYFNTQNAEVSTKDSASRYISEWEYPCLGYKLHCEYILPKDSMVVGYELWPNNDTVFFTILFDPQEAIRNEMISKIISENLKYPEEERENDHQDLVFVTFIFNEFGNATDIDIAKGKYENLNLAAMEAVSIFKGLPPVLRDGRPVKVRYNLPINFTLKSKRQLAKEKALQQQ